MGKADNLLPEIFHVVAAQYDLTIGDALPVRSAYRIITDQGTLFFKGTSYDEGRMLFIYSAIEHLRHNGFPFVPYFILTKEGKPFAKVDGNVCFISQWVEGRECDFKRTVDLVKATKSLARLHQAAKGFVPIEGSKVKSNLGTLPDKFTERLEDLRSLRAQVLGKKKKEEFDALFLEHADDYLQMGEKALQVLKNSEYNQVVEKDKRERVFCHHDYTYHNLIIAPDKELYVIDFDYCQYEVKSYDVAKLMTRIMRRDKFNFERVKLILDVYQTIEEISFGELQVILSILCFPQKFWRIANRYYYQKKDYTEKKYIKELKKITEYKEELQELLMEYEKMLANFRRKGRG